MPKLTNMNRPQSLIRRAQGGISLVESLLAILILSIALIGTLGLQARSIAALSDAGLRAEATIAANQLLGIMYSDLSNASTYALATATTQPSDNLKPWLDEVKTRIPGAAVTIGVATDSSGKRTEVNIAIRWQRTSDSQANTHAIKSYLTAAK